MDITLDLELKKFTSLINESTNIFNNNDIPLNKKLLDLNRVYYDICIMIDHLSKIPNLQENSLLFLQGRNDVTIKIFEVQNRIFKEDFTTFNEKLKEIDNSIIIAKSGIDEINNIKSSLFGFFGIIVGVLAFVFVNFQLFSKASDLKIREMIVFLGISNICLILGLGFFLNTLSTILVQKKTKFNNTFFWISIGFSMLLVFSNRLLF